MSLAVGVAIAGSKTPGLGGFDHGGVSVDETIPRFDGVAGALQGSGVTLTDADVIGGLPSMVPVADAFLFNGTGALTVGTSATPSLTSASALDLTASTGNAMLTSVLGDVHLQHELTTGNVAFLEDANIYGGVKRNPNVSLGPVFTSAVTDAATAEGFVCSTDNALTTAGAVIYSFENNDVRKAAIDKDGFLDGPGVIMQSDLWTWSGTLINRMN